MIRTIIPPYIHEKIVINGDPSERESALQNLSVAQTHRHLRSQPGAKGKKFDTIRRTIYDAKNNTSLPGRIVRHEGDSAISDVAANEAYDGLGATYKFFDDVYGRNSIDGEGMALDATVHFDKKYSNAFWDGSQMVFGDGDGVFFNRFTISLDVIGHELTHGITEDESHLHYSFQPGAVNESLSDIFGVLVAQYAMNQTADKADWLIGAGLLTKRVNGKAIRSMKMPGTAFDDPVLGKDPQPAEMNDYVYTYGDNGGVHINSGIPNRAFYLAALNIGGYAWEKAGRIWYETLCNPKMRSTFGFKRFAGLTLDIAASLYGKKKSEYDAVHDAWENVGVIK